MKALPFNRGLLSGPKARYSGLPTATFSADAVDASHSIWSPGFSGGDAGRSARHDDVAGGQRDLLRDCRTLGTFQINSVEVALRAVSAVDGEPDPAFTGWLIFEAAALRSTARNSRTIYRLPGRSFCARLSADRGG